MEEYINQLIEDLKLHNIDYDKQFMIKDALKEAYQRGRKDEMYCEKCGVIYKLHKNECPPQIEF